MEVPKVVSEAVGALLSVPSALWGAIESLFGAAWRHPMTSVAILVAMWAAAMVAGRFLQWRREITRRQHARRNSRRTPGPQYFEVVDLTVADQARLWWRSFVERLRRARASAQWHPSEFLGLPPAVGAGTIAALRKLVDAEPHDAMILGGVISVPWPILGTRPRLSSTTLAGIHHRPMDNKFVHEAVDRVIRVMASAGYMPQIHSHAFGTSEYFFLAKGIEDRDHNVYYDHPHKLPFRAATIMPQAPFGHTLYGDRADRHDGTMAPDVVAFIMIDQSSNRWALGPRIYWLDKLKEYLDAEHVSALQQKNFHIIPDPSIPDNKHSAIDDVELFGKAKDETEFMRFDYTRIEPASNSPHPNQARRAIWALRKEIDRKSKESSHETDMIPGDVLLVNNWRAATAWDEECKMLFNFRPIGFSPYSIHVHGGGHGDRMVFQIDFHRVSGRRKPTDDDHGHGHGGGHH